MSGTCGETELAHTGTWQVGTVAWFSLVRLASACSVLICIQHLRSKQIGEKQVGTQRHTASWYHSWTVSAPGNNVRASYIWGHSTTALQHSDGCK